MYIPVTYEQDFDDLWMHLKSKYPEKLFNLDGVGEQLDMSKFSKKFFSSAVTSDASIDANANVDDMSVIAYEKELPKPFLKMNSYYILWKELKKLYGRPFADSVVEMQLTGDIYINDMHGIGAGKPYSYFGDTRVVIPDKEWPFVTLCDLWNQYAEQMPVTDHGDYEEIIPEDLKVLDADDSYVRVSRIVRHQNTQPLLDITVGGDDEPQFQLRVTADHPIILENGSELPATQLKVGDALAMSQRFRNYILDKQRLDLKIYDSVNVVSSISPMPELDPKDFGDKAIYVYDITTETGTFAADGIFKAHNCFNYSTYDILTKGLPMVKKVKCEPPKYLYSFKSQLEQFVTIASNSTLGASGTADMLIMMAYYVKNMLNTLSDAHFTFADEDAVWRYVRENLVSFVYTINQPMRGNQCVTEDTEVLTPGGWKKYDELHVGDDIYTWHDNELRIQQVQRVNVNDYDGEMHRYRGERFDMQVTPNHRVLYATDSVAKDLKLQSSQEIMDNEKIYIPVVASDWQGGEESWPQAITSESLDVAITKERVRYQGKVWCPTTEDGVVVFRHNGTAFISGNSPFTNLSVYDDNFLDKLCADYIFPDGSTPDKEIVKKLQNIYLDIMNEELQRTPLTFPVTTACFSIDKDNNIQDEAFLHNIAQKNLQWGFINMYAGSSSTLSSCCRLRSEQQSEYFNSFGSGSSKIGSLGVCTINFPRLAIQYPLEEDFMEKLEEMVGVCAKVNNAKRHIVQKRINNGNEPLYKYEFMELSKQYSTCGVNGFYETIKLLGYDILTEEGQALALRILDKINDTNKIYQNKYKMPHNVEQVPGENLSIKLAEKDKLMGYQNEYNLYSNQFIPLIANADLFDRIKLQGLFDSHFSGGSICHLNVETQITDVKDMEDLIRVAAKKGVVYFAINYVLSQCTNGHMSVTNGDKCLVCGEPITDKYTRVVGFLTNIKNWHKVRREEDFPNRQFYQGEEIAPPEEEIEKVDLARNAKE